MRFCGILNVFDRTLKLALGCSLVSSLFGRNRFAVAILIALVFFGPATSAKPQTAGVRAEYERLSQEFAASVSNWRSKRPVTGSLLFLAPDEYSGAGQDGERFREARNKYADSLFTLAKQAAEAGQSSLAFQWATEAVREKPDHAEARRVLGYEQRNGHWLTAYGVKMFDAGKIWNPKFGWVAAADVPRYEKGERFSNGHWVSAAADAARHGEMKNGWQLHTDHFLVATNHSLEAAAELAARLERLYQIWRELFAGFYLPDKEVRGLFTAGSHPRSPLHPFRVFYHRDREQYNAALRSRQSRISETLGIYFDTTHEAHFFAGEGQDRGTLYHEAVHQLFQESKPAAKHIGERSNAWVIEGVATYFETLSEQSEPNAGLYYTIGELTKGRLPAARQRLKDGSYIPLAELTRIGRDELQQPDNIAKRYSEACGLAAFLIDGDQGRHREPLVHLLQAVYAGHDNEQTLADATGTSYSELDAAYRKYMESLP